MGRKCFSLSVERIVAFRLAKSGNSFPLHGERKFPKRAIRRDYALDNRVPISASGLLSEG
jgi:hypothetical protein